MSISFSGLASGLDTSSWIKSLTALKQAKVTVLEEEKEQVLLSQDTLNNIKTFFNSFRSTIEKITDSKFNIPTMDLFAQNLAISANLDVLTATATHEAVEGKYEVKVDKLATNTNAVSGYKYTTTITETTMATLDSKLTDLGASAGNILVNVKSAGGIQRGVQIEENETIGTFITKLEGIGVSAHFNETTGIFSIDVGANDITDIGNTNIVSALHLSGVNEGYKSNTLEVKKVETVFEQADEDTTLGQLGVTDGRITIESNDVAYDIDLATDDTLGELLTALRTNGIEASLVDGRFMIENAKITADTANFVNSFGLAEETAERSQVSNNLTYQTTVVEVTEADLSTKLSALGNGTVVNAGDTVIVKNSNNEYHTITLGVESTLGDLMTGLSNAGLNAEVKNDGTIEITGGTITGGTFDAIEALGLNTDPYTAYVTGNALTETIETFELVTLDTRLVDDLGVSEGYLEVTDSEGNIQYLKIYSGQTIQNLMADLAGFGIDAELEEDTGILTITGGAFETLTDADVNALIASNTIAEAEDRYKHGTNLLTLLYGQESINLNQTEVAQTFARSRALYQSVTNTVLATEDSTLQALDAMDDYTDLPSGASDAVFNVRGALVTVAITDTMTVGELVDAINAQGIEAEFDSLTGLLTVNNATIESCPLAGVLNMETSIAGKYVTSDAVFAVATFSIDATEATTLGYLGLSVGSTETIKLYDNEDNFVTEFDVTDETTLGEIIETINTSGCGAVASLVNGELKIENGKIENTAIDSVLGLKETYSGISHVLGTSLTVETTYKITGESELGNIIDTMGTGTYVQGGYTLTFNGHSMTVGANTTINDVINQVYDLGGTAQVDAAGLLHINGGVLEGTVAQALGFSSVTVTLGVAATGNTMSTDTTVSADGNTTFEDLGFNADSTVTVYDSLNQAVATITMSKTETLDDFFEKLSAQGIEASISDGVISLTSPTGNYITGQIATALGIGIIENESGINTNQTSTTPLTQTITEIAKESDKLSDIITKLGTTSAVSGGYDMTFNGDALAVDGDTTLASIMQQIQEKGGTAFIDSSGRLQISGGTVTGTVANALGIESRTVTLGVAATGNTMSADTTVSADGNTTFEDLGFNADSTVTVYDSLNQAVATITMSKTETLDDFFEKLSAQGIEASISDGVISLTSPNGNYITGQIATALNIGTIENESGINTNQTSTTPLTQTITEIAKESDKLSDIITKLGTTSAVSGGYDMTFNGDALAVDGDTTLASIMQQIQEKGGTAFIDSSGRLQISGGTVTGTVANALGIESRTVTLGVAATGDTLKTEQVIYADQNTKLSELGITTSDTAVVRDADGTSIATFSMEADATLGDFFEELEAYDIIATVSNGVISFTSQSGNYVASDNNIALKLGIATAEGSVLENTTQTSTAIVLYTTTSTATGDAALGDVLQHLGTLEGCENELYINGTRVTAWFNMTLNQLMEQINIAGGSAQLDSSGRLHISGGTVTGSIADALGLVGTTLTAGVTSAGSTLTTTQTANAGRDNTFSEIFSDMIPSTDVSMQVYDSAGAVLGTITVNGSTELGTMMDQLEGYGITATLSDGVLSLSSLSGAYVEGALATKLGIETKTTTAVANMTQSSTLGVTYTGTRVVTGSDKLEDVLPYQVFMGSSVHQEYTSLDYNIVALANSTGTVDSSTTYAISTTDDLLALDKLVEEGRCSGALFVMTNDIDLSGVEFDGIGSATQGFVGTFNGNGYTISNLRNEVGLFHNISAGQIAGITIDNAHITATGNVDNAAGILAAKVSNTVDTVYFTGNEIKNSSITAKNDGLTIGGLVGVVDTTFWGLQGGNSVEADIDLNGTNSTAGGLTGSLSTMNGYTSNNPQIKNNWYNIENATCGALVGESSSSYALLGQIFAGENTPTDVIGNYGGGDISGQIIYQSSLGTMNVPTSSITVSTTEDTECIKNVIIYVKQDNTNIGTITLSSTTTIDEMLAQIRSYGLNATLNDGVISISSTENKYIEGHVLSGLGIKTEKSGGGTISSSASSNIQIAYTNTVTATTSSKISDIVDFSVEDALSKTLAQYGITDYSYSIYNSSNQLLTQGNLSSTHTLDYFINTLCDDYDIDVEIVDGKIQQSSTMGYRIEGPMVDKFTEGVLLESTITITQNGTEIATITVGTDDTIDDLLTTFAAYDIAATMENGVITFDNQSGVVAKGAILDAMGIEVVSSSTTFTQGTVASSDKAITYTYQVLATADSTLEELGILAAGQTTTITANVTTTEGFVSVVEHEDTSGYKSITEAYADGMFNISDGETISISTKEELIMLKNGLYSGGWLTQVSGIRFVLANDIDMSGVDCGGINNFTGEFDGNGYVIENLTGTSGLFYSVNNGFVHDLGIVDCDISSASSTGALVNSLIGGKIDNCFTTGNVNSGNVAGGLVGITTGNSTIKSCFTSASVVSSSATAPTGGLVGVVNGSSDTLAIDNCHLRNNTLSYSTTSGNTGMLVGYNSGTINLGLVYFYDEGTANYSTEKVVGRYNGSINGGIIYSPTSWNLGQTNATIMSTTTFSENNDGYNTERRSSYTHTLDSTSTLQDYMDILNKYGYSASIEDGIIDIQNHKGHGWDLSGDLVTALSQTSEGTPTENEAGQIISNEAITFTSVSSSTFGFDATLGEVAPDLVGKVYGLNTDGTTSVFNTVATTQSISGYTKMTSTTALSANGKYYIEDAAGLKRFLHLVNNTTTTVDATCTFVLTKDIDMQGVTIETGSTNSSYAFQGKFYGNGHIISNYTASSSDKNIGGLFAFTNGATIQDVGLKDVTILSSYENYAFVGGIVGFGDSGTTINNCFFEGNIGASDMADIGGIVGYVYGADNKVTNISNNWSKVETSGGSNVGGIIGSTGSSDITIASNTVYLPEGFGVNAGTSCGLIGYNEYDLSNVSNNKIYGNYSNTNFIIVSTTGYISGSNNVYYKQQNGFVCSGEVSGWTFTTTNQDRKVVVTTADMTLDEFCNALELEGARIETFNVSGENKTLLGFDSSKYTTSLGNKGLIQPAYPGVPVYTFNDISLEKTTTTVTTFTEDTTFADLGIDRDDFVIIDTIIDQEYIYNWDDNDSIVDFFSNTDGYVKASVDNGKLVLETKEGCYISTNTYVLLLDKLNIETQVSNTDSNRLYENKIATMNVTNTDLTYTSVREAQLTDSFEQLGVLESGESAAVVFSNGIVNFTSSNTIEDFIEACTSRGIDAELVDGNIRLTGAMNDGALRGGTLLPKLGIKFASGAPTDASSVIQSESAVTYQQVNTVTLSSTLGDLGMADQNIYIGTTSNIVMTAIQDLGISYGSVPTVQEAIRGGGSLVSGNTYIVTSTYDLSALSDYVASGGSTDGVIIALETDIDFKDKTFTRIKNFNGNFYGQGHVIKNLKINQSGGTAGLFGELGAQAMVRDLGLVDAVITASTNYIGGIAGRTYGVIHNCFVTGSITRSGTSSSSDMLGGITGYLRGNSTSDYGVVSSCWTNIVTEGAGIVGGIVAIASSYCSITACETYIDDVAFGNNALATVGGIVGTVEHYTNVITSCHVSATEGLSLTNLDYVLGSVTSSATVSGFSYGSSITGKSVAQTTRAASVVQDRYRDSRNFGSTSTLAELLEYIGAENVSIIDNKLSFENGDRKYRVTNWGRLGTKTETTTDYGTTRVDFAGSKTNKTITSSTTFDNMGIDIDDVFVSIRTPDGVDKIYKPTSSSQTILDYFNSMDGVTATISSNKLTLTMADGYEISKAWSGIETEFNIDTTVDVWSDSDKLWAKADVNIYDDVVIGELVGVGTASGTWTIIDSTTGQVVDTFAWDKNYSLDDLEAFLENNGIDYSISDDGKLTLQQGQKYVTCSTSDKLWDALFGTSVEASDFTEEVTMGDGSMSASTLLTEKTAHTLTEETTLLELANRLGIGPEYIALNPTGVISNGVEYSITLSESTTVGNIIDRLAAYGIESCVENGKFYVKGGQDGSYVSAWSILGALLQLGNLVYETVPIEYTNSSSDKLNAKIDSSINENTFLGNISRFFAGNLIIHKADDSTETISVDAGETLGDFFDKIAVYGLTGSVNSDGEVTIVGLGNTFITDDSSNLLAVLNLGDAVGTGQEQKYNTSSNRQQYQAETVPDGNTLLENLYKNGAGIAFVDDKVNLELTVTTPTGTITTILEFTSEDSLYDVMDKLAEYGINTSIDTTGRFSVTNSAVEGFIMGGTLGEFLMGLNPTIVETPGGIEYVSNELIQTTTPALTTEALLSSFGVTNGNVLVKKTNGDYATIAIDNSKTIGDFFTQIGQYGLTATINDGKVSIVGAGDVHLEAAATDASNILTQLSLGSVVENYKEFTYNTNSDEQSETVTVAVVGTTKLEDILNHTNVGPGGYTLELTTNSKAGSETVTITTLTGTSTLNDLFDVLAEHGITAYVGSDGRLNLNSATLTDFSFGGALGNYLNVANKKYNEVNTNSTSTNLSSTTDVSIDGKVVLNTLNISNGDLKIHKADGSYATITIDNTKTIADFFTQIAQYGLNGTIGDDGIITLSGSGDVYLESVAGGSNIIDKLGLADVVRNTSIVTSNTNSDKQTDISTGSANGSTKLGDLNGITNYVLEVSTKSNTGDLSTTLTFTTEDTLNDVFDKLAELGITATIGADGRISMNGEDLSDFTIGGGLGTFLMGSYEKVYDKVDTNSKSTILETSTTGSADGNVTLEYLGVTNGNLRVHKSDGTYETITIDKTKTLSEFFTQISEYGLNASIDSNGIITITGSGDVYLESVAGGSNIIDKLGLADVVRNTSIVTSNTNSDKQTDISTGSANGSTKLGDLNGITNYVLEVSTKSNTGDLSTTLTFTTEDTLNDVFDKLAELGITATIGADGRISMNGEDLSDFTIGGGLGTFLMGSYEKVYDKVTTNNVSANLLYTVVENMNNDTKLSDLGVTNADGFELEINDVFYTLTISETATIGEFRDLLANYGIRSDVFSGKLSLSADGIVRLRDKSGTDIITDLGLDNMTGGNVSQESDILGDTDTNTNFATMSARISELTDSSGNSLGITGGEIYVYQDGTRNLVNINVNDTLETLAAKLSQYGITMGIAQNGQIYFDGNNNSYLTTDGLTSATSSNILQKLNIETWETRYNSTSEVLDHEEQNDVGVSGDTKLVDLRNADGDSLGITTGEYTVFSNGVRTTETITDDTTVDDFIATMATYGMVAQIDSSGQINIGAQNNTYLATSASAGDNTNAIDVLFEEWNFVNIYTSNNLEIPEDVTVAVSKTTKLADINEGAYEDGYITVVHNGVQTNISLTADDTVGTLMDELALYGFDCVINDAGQLIVKNTGNSILQNYNGTDKASNALEILGVDLDNWITTNLYTGQAIDVIKETDKDAAADRNTKLSKLGVTTGEYNIYSNGVKYTALISSDETVGSFLDTLAAFGIQANIVDNGTYSVLQLQGNGDSYIAKTASAVNQSNVVDVLFPPIPGDATYNYSADLQTSTLVTTYTSATEDTLLSALDVTWGNDVLKAEGVLSVTVDGETSYISIAADETIGTLLSKFRMLGLEASINNGELLIQSGHSVFTINSDGTTSSLLPNLGIAYHDDLGGYAASSAIVEQTVTWDELITESVAEYADENTVMSLLNISSGTLSVYKNGQRATIQIDQDETFGMLQARVATALSGVVVEVDDTGYLTFSSTNGDSVEVGATTDTSNFSAICGLSNDKSGTVKSARQLYKVNGDSLVTSADLFRKEDVTEGTFIIGNATFTIDNTTTLSSIISQINASDDANATAQWDSIDGKLVITSRTTGSAFINIEAGTSNFTDVMGLTKTEVDAVSGDQITRILVDAQTIGDNAQFSINGTHFTSTSNTITSDLSRIQGLTINLKGVTGEGGSTTLTVERDKETLATAVSDIVDAYNELIENVDKEVARGAQLADQSTLKMIRNQIRSLMTSSLSGMSVFKNLDAVGISADKASANNISTEKVNVLNFDKDRFLSAFDADRTALKQLLVGTDSNLGIFSRIENVLESALTGVSGYFESANRSYQKEISRIDKKIERANKEVERYKARLEAKFSAMDLLIAKMQNQYSSFLG